MSNTAWSSMALVALLALAVPRPVKPAPQHDFLTQTESDRIRDAESANERVTLFLDFAADRLRRFDHELRMSGAGPRRSDYLNDLLDAFDSCVNAASDRIDDAMSHGENMRKGIQDMKKRGADLQAELKKIKAEGAQLDIYRDTLDDTMGDLKEDIQNAEKAGKRLDVNLARTKPHHQELH